jgi:hypothetical protein
MMAARVRACDIRLPGKGKNARMLHSIGLLTANESITCSQGE